LDTLHYKGRLSTTMNDYSLILFFTRQFSIPVPIPYTETSRPTVECYPVSYSMVTGGSFPGVKTAWTWRLSLNFL